MIRMTRVIHQNLPSYLLLHFQKRKKEEKASRTNTQPFSEYFSEYSSVRMRIIWCFLFYQKNVHFTSKNAMLCLFLKNVSPSKRVICFILNNLHFPMVEGIAFNALHKSRVLIIPYKTDGFCLFIGLPNEI